jgi:hypothetical protein
MQRAVYAQATERPVWRSWQPPLCSPATEPLARSRSLVLSRWPSVARSPWLLDCFPLAVAPPPPSCRFSVFECQGSRPIHDVFSVVARCHGPGLQLDHLCTVRRYSFTCGRWYFPGSVWPATCEYLAMMAASSHSSFARCLSCKPEPNGGSKKPIVCVDEALQGVRPRPPDQDKIE